jgi:CRISPR-associated protein Cas2
MLYLIVYDISENKIRNRVSKILKQYGQRVQNSAFEIEISKRKLKAIFNEIEKIIDSQTDSIFAFELPQETQKTIFKIGQKERLEYVL